ncbi:MAG: polymerase [Treponema sp.]|nr:polymerase [Treponema sp.]
MKKYFFISIFLFTGLILNAQGEIGISGSLGWDNGRMDTVVSLDLASAGLKLPAGRTQAEALLGYGFQSLIMPGLLALQVDSSSTIADLIDRGEISLSEAEIIAMNANSIAPSLSPDMRSITASYSISIANIRNALLKHSRSASVIRTLNPVSSAQYTGIIIIAVEELPAHGMRGKEMPVPCLFPKIWDSEMNLIYDRSMIDPPFTNAAIVKYSAAENIFQNNPSGLSQELREIAGDRPLRIFARGVFGIKPTDLIIDRRDALLIISSEENRRLLSEGKVVFVLDDSVLRNNFSGK